MARTYTARTDRRLGPAVPECSTGLRFAGTPEFPEGLLIGLDVGSTTVKAMAANPCDGSILWKDYQRHETRQLEKCLDFLERMTAAFPAVPQTAFRVFVTGSGGSAISRLIGGCYVQEVNAVSLAVERAYPDVRSVVELGGQDAKIIIFKPDPETGKIRKFPSMNDKCAGGTGAIIDKIAVKLGVSLDRLGSMPYAGVRLHPVAGKCGVFAETDINSLQKQGVPAEELVASLFESLVQQNLAVLTRGHTLRPKVLLLGGPNFFLRGLQECWRHNIPLIWRERGIQTADGARIEDLILIPENAQFFGALGALEFGRLELEDNPHIGVYAGPEGLRRHIEKGRAVLKHAAGEPGLVSGPEELAAFREKYLAPEWAAPVFPSGSVVEAFLGLDGGSTSTKAVLVDAEKRILAKAYQLSKGNPIEDTQDVLRSLEEQMRARGARLRILGVATTGYAKDILKDVIGADVALVETVAHAQSGLHYYPHADVICDVGGQDIKIIFLKNGTVKDFRLNTQCSAGNGYYLQSTAASFGYPVEEYAEVAFSAQTMPQFGYGCAVFLQTDIVDFQRQGWQPNEILAGLAAVLPKNIWLYVCQIPNLAQFGRTFVLQGGTQRNLAAVKAQVDFISDRFQGTGVVPEVIVHEHCGESGAIGCAFEVHRIYYERGLETSFIGLEAVQSIRYRTTRNESTRCDFCKNRCMRMFLDVRSTARTGDGVDMETHPIKIGPQEDHPSRVKHTSAKPRRPSSVVPLAPGEQRLIIATCEKGTVEDVADMRVIQKEIDAVKRANPNLADYAARETFKPVAIEQVADPLPSPWRFGFLFSVRRSRRRARMERRKILRIGIPRVMNMYGLAPFFMGCFQSLGIPGDRIVWSDPTSDKLFREGAKRGSIDPCFPSKVCIPHVHNLLYVKHAQKRLTHVFFPMIESIPTAIDAPMDSMACPTSTATPEAVHAAFIKEGDVFAERGIVFKKTFMSIARPALCARQFAEDWEEEIGVTEEEANRAIRAGLAALSTYQGKLRSLARQVLDELERTNRLGIVLLARPYHSDPGINHGICEAFQKLGYPVLIQDSLPLDDDVLQRVFADDLASGTISSPCSIEDVWKNSFSENSSRKIWAAKFVARHPNLIPLELSNFKCGHDAAIYSLIEEIVEQAQKPYFYFKDIDENKPAGSVKIRIETIAYFLRRFSERMLAEKTAREEIERRLQEYEQRLRAAFSVEDPLSAAAV